MSWRAAAGHGGVQTLEGADGAATAFDRYGEGEPLVVVIGRDATTHWAIGPGVADVTIVGSRPEARTGE